MQRTLIVLVVGLLVAGCGETEEPVKEELTVEEKKALRDSVVGEYEYKLNGDTIKQVLLENGIGKDYENGKLTDEGKWKIVNGKLHVIYEEGSEVGGGGEWVTQVHRINRDRSHTFIAEIDKSGKRTDVQKGNQATYKKIK